MTKDKKIPFCSKPLYVAGTRMGQFPIVLGCFCLLAIASCALGDTETLRPVADTFINSGQTGNNAGATAWFDAGTDGREGTRRGLIKSGLSSIPYGSTITSAVLRLKVIQVPDFG